MLFVCEMRASTQILTVIMLCVCESAAACCSVAAVLRERQQKKTMKPKRGKESGATLNDSQSSEGMNKRRFASSSLPSHQLMLF